MGYYDDFGGVIDGFGDVNGDGLDDIIVNSKNNYINENSYFLFGATYLVLGREL